MIKGKSQLAEILMIKFAYLRINGVDQKRLEKKIHTIFMGIPHFSHLGISCEPQSNVLNPITFIQQTNFPLCSIISFLQWRGISMDFPHFWQINGNKFYTLFIFTEIFA